MQDHVAAEVDHVTAAMKRLQQRQATYAVQVLVFVLLVLTAECIPQTDELHWADLATNNVHHAAVKQNEKESATCELCQFILKETVQMVGRSVLKPLIENLYENCGKYIDIPYLCTGLRKDFLNLMADMLNSLDRGLCVDATFCPPTADIRKEDSTRLPWLLVARPGQNNSILCTVCKDIVGVMDSLVYKYLDKAVAMVSEFCHRLAPPTDKECVQELLDPLTAFIKQLEQEFGPTYVCTNDIPVCTDTRQ